MPASHRTSKQRTLMAITLTHRSRNNLLTVEIKLAPTELLDTAPHCERMTPQDSRRERQNFVRKLLCPRLKKITPRATHQPCKIAQIGEKTQETAMQCEEAQSLDTARLDFSVLNRIHSSISTDLIHELQNSLSWMTRKDPFLWN